MNAQITTYTSGKTTQTRIYAGDFERLSQNGTTTSYLYIYSPDGLVGIYVKPSNGTAEMHYAVTDHLGSLLALYKSNFTQTYAATYDAWGKQTISKNTLNLRRGYCQHEHWPEFGLIDMNGRFYDPQLAHFLSPDPYVQDMTNPQNFNRYSYCLNNPLKYSDPSGEFWHIVIGAAIGGTINWLAHGHEFSWKGFGYFNIGALAGAASAATCGGISSAMAGGSFGAGAGGTSAAMSVSSSFASGAAIGAVSGAIGGTITEASNAWMGGSSFGQGVRKGFIGGNIGGLAGGLIGGVAGGIDAYCDNRNVWTGKDVAMGRTQFSFKNTDLDATHYWGKGNWRITKSHAQDLLSDNPKYDYAKWGYVVDKNGCSVNGLSKLENYTFQNCKRNIPITKGHSFLEVVNGTSFNYNLSVDGVPLLYENGHYIIPNGAKVLTISFSPINSYTNVTEPFKCMIYGIPK